MKYFLFSVFSLLLQSYYSQVFTYLDKVLPTDGITNDEFGREVEISGNWAVVGVPRNSDVAYAAGAVYLFEYNGSEWIQKQKITAFDGETGNIYGSSVSIHGNVLVVGSFRDNDLGTWSGSVYVYEYNGTQWNFTQKLLAFDGTAGQIFGFAVSNWGNKILVGAYRDDQMGTDAGAAYFYEKNGATWNLTNKVVASDGALSDSFGYSVALNDTSAVIGSPGDGNINGNNAGAVYIFRYNGTIWNQQLKLIESTTDWAGGGFGNVVKIENERIAISCSSFNSLNQLTGGVYTYLFNGSTFVLENKFLPSDLLSGDMFGDDISIQNETLIVGCPGSDDNGNDSGSAYLFHFDGVNWVQNLKIIPEENASDDYFGISVALENGIAFIGSYYEDDNGTNSGTCYTFKTKGVYGKVYLDVNTNCLNEPIEIGIPYKFGIIQPGSILIQTDSEGVWYVDSLAPGAYTLYPDTSGTWYNTCTLQTFDVLYANAVTDTPKTGIASTSPCSLPNVSINFPTIRPCFNSKVYIQVSNESNGTDSLNNQILDIILDSAITVINASIPITIINDHHVTAVLNDLYPGQSQNFWINTSVSCVTQLGKTLCVKAEIIPADDCYLDTIPSLMANGLIAIELPQICNTPYDGSEIKINGWCNLDSIYFNISNIATAGIGDMSCYSSVVLYVDSTIILIDSVSLLGNESKSYSFLSDGRTWRMYVDQHPLHPGNSYPNAFVEACGSLTNWTPDLVNILPLDDADPQCDIYCGIVTASYDPNDKRGFPLGLNEAHTIQPNQQLDYMIRFQNTGSDTAFLVVIRDTLDEVFDIFSVNSGVSSHPYSFRMYGPRVLEWTFDNILLPDSLTDEEGSKGFITFKVNHVPGIPLGTILENNADIYFDFNSPIITNTSWHTLNQFQLNTASISQELQLAHGKLTVWPNPSNGKINVKSDTDIDNIDFQMTDNCGRIVLTGILNKPLFEINCTHLNSGTYFLKIQNKTVKIQII